MCGSSPAATPHRVRFTARAFGLTWGVFVEAVWVLGPPQGRILLASSQGLQLWGRNRLPPEDQACLERVWPRVVRALQESQLEADVTLLEYDFPILDYQAEGIACSLVQWGREVAGLPLEPIVWRYDAGRRWYLFEL